MELQTITHTQSKNGSFQLSLNQKFKNVDQKAHYKLAKILLLYTLQCDSLAESLSETAK